MATTNLHLATKLDGQPLQLRDIKRGIKANFPSGAGGVITCICSECTDTHAVFTSTNKEWPATWKIEVGVQDLSREEFLDLPEAIKAYDSAMMACTAAQRALVIRAKNLGYASVRSQTQASWTELGIATLQSHKAALNA